MVLRKQRKYVVGMEPVKIIDKGCRLCKPLAVKLAPKRLCPACIRNGEMKSVRVNTVPVFSGYKVTEGVFVIVKRHLRIPGGAGGKEHEHRIITLR